MSIFLESNQKLCRDYNSFFLPSYSNSIKQLLEKKVLLLATNVYVKLRTINIFVDFKPELIFALSLAFLISLCSLTLVVVHKFILNLFKNRNRRKRCVTKFKKNGAEMDEMLNILCDQ